MVRQANCPEFDAVVQALAPESEEQSLDGHAPAKRSSRTTALVQTSSQGVPAMTNSEMPCRDSEPAKQQVGIGSESKAGDDGSILETGLILSNGETESSGNECLKVLPRGDMVDDEGSGKFEVFENCFDWSQWAAEVPPEATPYGPEKNYGDMIFLVDLEQRAAQARHMDVHRAAADGLTRGPTRKDEGEEEDGNRIEESRQMTEKQGRHCSMRTVPTDCLSSTASVADQDENERGSSHGVFENSFENPDEI